MTIQELIKEVEATGKAAGLTHTQIAARLGISGSYLHMVASGKYKPGMKVIQGITSAFPQLRQHVLDYLGN